MAASFMPGPPWVPIRGLASPTSLDALDWHRKPSSSRSNEDQNAGSPARRKNANDVYASTSEATRRQRTRSIDNKLSSDRSQGTAHGMARRGGGDALGANDRRHTVAESSRTANARRSGRRATEHHARLETPSPRRLTPSPTLHADMTGRMSSHPSTISLGPRDDHGDASAGSITPPPPLSMLPRGILVPADRVILSAASIALHAANGGKGKGRVDDGAWVSKIGRFELAGEIQLPGFSLMAVDKWILDRSKCFRTVFRVSDRTSDDLVSAALLIPTQDLSEAEAAAEIEEGKRKLTRYGLRAIETECGTVMVIGTPRNDAQYIPIPKGDFRDSQDDLFVNINLRRMGCAGRLSLSLEPPSATIQQKALQTYRLPGQSASPFTTLILELVKLVQTALYLHGLYGFVAGEDIDGLLCNETLSAIRKWRQLFSKDTRNAYLDENCMAVMGSVIVAELLSSVSSIRYKLEILDIDKTPHDPFSRISDFETALLNFQRMRHRGNMTAHLTPTLVQEINEAYAKEAKTAGRKIRKLVRTQVSQAGMGIASNLASLSIGSGRHHDEEEDEEPSFTAEETLADGGKMLPPDRTTTSIEQFQRAVVTNARHKHTVGRGRIRSLWMGEVHTPMFDRISAHSPTMTFPIHPARPGSIASSSNTPGIRGVTSRTGHALKDGLTHLARRGHRGGLESDSDSGARTRRHTSPLVVLQSGSGEELTDSSRRMSLSPVPANGKARLQLPPHHHHHHRAVMSRGSPVPSSSMALTESAFSGSEHDPTRLVRSRSSTSPMPDMVLARTPRGRVLERNVSCDNFAEIDNQGVEFIHAGHAPSEWRAFRVGREERRGLLRRRSDSQLDPTRDLECSESLRADVQTCASIWQLMAQKRAFERRVRAFEELERAVQDAAQKVTRTIQERRARFEGLQRESERVVRKIYKREPGAATATTTTGSSSFGTPKAAAAGSSANDAAAAAAAGDGRQTEDTAAINAMSSDLIASALRSKGERLTYNLRELDKSVDIALAHKETIDAMLEDDRRHEFPTSSTSATTKTAANSTLPRSHSTEENEHQQQPSSSSSSSNSDGGGGDGWWAWLRGEGGGEWTLNRFWRR